MANLKITIEDLNDPKALSQKKLRDNPTGKPVSTTRSKQFVNDRSIDPEGANLVTQAQLFLGTNASVSPDEMMGQYESLMTSGVSHIYAEPEAGDYSSILPPGTDLTKVAPTGGPSANVQAGSEVQGDASAVIQMALSEVGYTEGASNDNKFAAEAGHTPGLAWCATFVAAMFKRAGIEDAIIDSASTEEVRRRAIEAGKWGTRSEGAQPVPGAVVFFNYRGPSRNVSHNALVVRVDGDHLVTVEGNTSNSDSGSQDNGDGVFQKRRRINTAVGYYYPEYTNTQDQLDNMAIEQEPQ